MSPKPATGVDGKVVPGAELVNEVPALTGRARRKAKQKAKASGEIFEDPPAAENAPANPYNLLNDDDAGDVKPVEDSEPDMRDFGTKNPPTDDSRPKTSSSGASVETLVDQKHDEPITEDTAAANTEPPKPAEPEKFTPSEWTDTDTLDINPSAPYLEHEELSAEDQAKQDIRDWFTEQKGHVYTLKQITFTKLSEFVYGIKYRAVAEDDDVREAWTTELRCVFWRAVVRANFWWVNPDTSKPEKIKPVSAPTGMYQGHYELFVLCAAERLDRIGRDLPDPAYVASIETNVRTFLRRVENNSLIKELEHLAFLLLLDEEQNRTLSKEDLQTRLRLVFDGVKGMEWKWCGVAVMGQMPNKKAEHPTRAESIWQDVLREWKLYD